MRPTIRDLKAERHETLKKAYAIIQKAEAEARGVTSIEGDRFEDLLEEAERLGDRIRVREAEEGGDLPIVRPSPGDGMPGGGGAPGEFWNPGEQGIRFRSSDGRELRAYTHGERIGADYRSGRVNGVPAEDLSLGRFVRALSTGNWAGAEAERRALGEGTPSAGGVLVPTPLGARVIDLARDLSALSAAGMLTIPMESETLSIPRILTDPTPAWKSESAAGAESEGSFGEVKLDSRTLFVYTKLSRELLDDSPFAPDAIERQLSAAMAQEIDRAGLFGSGTPPEPQGLLGTSGIGAQELGVGDGASLVSYVPFSQAVETLLAANRQARAVIMAPRTWGSLDRLEATDKQPLMPPQSWSQIPRKLVASKVPTDQTVGTSNDCSTAFVGDFADMVMGVRLNVQLMASEQASDASSRAFTHFEVWIRAVARVDFAVLRPSSFVAITGIRP